MSEIGEMKREFEEVESRIERLKKAERELNTLGTQEWRESFRKEIEAIRTELKSPSKVDEVESKLSNLREQVKPEISVSFSENEFPLNTWSDVSLMLGNTGRASRKKSNRKDAKECSSKWTQRVSYTCWRGRSQHDYSPQTPH